MKSSLDNLLNSLGAQNGTTIPLSLAAMLSQTGPQGGAALLSPSANGNSSAPNSNPLQLQELLAQLQSSGNGSSSSATDSAPDNTVSGGSSSDTLQGGTGQGVTLQNDLPSSQIGSSDPDSMQNPTNQAMLQGVLSGNGGNVQNSSVPADMSSAVGSASSAPAQGTPSTLSSALNNMASGAGNTDYDAIRAAYPQSVTEPVQSADELQQQYVASHLNDSPLNNIVAGKSYAQAAQRQQQMQQDELQNRDNVNAYEAAFKAATESGKTQHEAAALAEEVVKDKNTQQYQQGELGYHNLIAQAVMAKDTRENAKLVPMADGSMGLYDAAHPENGIIPLAGTQNKLSSVVKPLPAAQQLEINRSLSKALSNVDEDGKKTTIPLDPSQELAIQSEAANRLKSGDATSGADAVNSVIGDLTGGKDLNDVLQPQTKPGLINRLTGGAIATTNNTGRMQFPDLSAITGTKSATPSQLSAVTGNQMSNPQASAPQVATSMIPAGQMPVDGTSGPIAPIDKLVAGFMQKHPDATQDQVARVRAAYTKQLQDNQ